VGLFENVWERGGGGGGACLGLKTASKTPWKETHEKKRKMKLYKGWKKQQKFVYMTEKKKKLCKRWTLGEIS
jgi:hypothetical protein